MLCCHTRLAATKGAIAISACCHCREYLVDMLLEHAEAPMLLEECNVVLEHMDGKVHPVDIMQFRFKQDAETVGLKRLRR